MNTPPKNPPRKFRVVEKGRRFFPRTLQIRPPKPDAPDIPPQKLEGMGRDMRDEVRFTLSQSIRRLLDVFIKTHSDKDGLYDPTLEFTSDELDYLIRRIRGKMLSAEEQGISFAERIQAFNRLYQWEIAPQVTENNSTPNPTGGLRTQLGEKERAAITKPVVLSSEVLHELGELIKTVGHFVREDEKPDLYTHTIWAVDMTRNFWYALNIIKDKEGGYVTHIQPAMVWSREWERPLLVEAERGLSPDYSEAFWDNISEKIRPENSIDNPSGEVLYSIPDEMIHVIDPIALSQREIVVPIFYTIQAAQCKPSILAGGFNTIIFATDEADNLLLIHASITATNVPRKIVIINHGAIHRIGLEEARVKSTQWGRFLPHDQLVKIAASHLKERREKARKALPEPSKK